MISKPSSSFGKYLLKMPGNLVIQISNFSLVWADMIDSNLASPGGASGKEPTCLSSKEEIKHSKDINMLKVYVLKSGLIYIYLYVIIEIITIFC